MRTIIITGEKDLPQEVEAIRNLMSEKVIVHVRKKEKTQEEMSTYLDQFNGLDKEYITIHGYPDLAINYKLGGIHLSASDLLPEDFNWQGRLSRSCHSFSEIFKLDQIYSYVFLSPVYNSISKPGYNSSFSEEELISNLSHIKDQNVYALGGVTVEKFDELDRFGFVGAAISGDFWNNKVTSWNKYLTERIAHE